MISSEEWDALKVGDHVYYVSNTDHTITENEVIDVKQNKDKKKIRLNPINRCFVDKHCFGTNHFVSEIEALKFQQIWLDKHISNLMGMSQGSRQRLDYLLGK